MAKPITRAVVARKGIDRRKEQLGTLVWHDNTRGFFKVPISKLSTIRNWHSVPATTLNRMAKKDHPKANFQESPGFVYLSFNLRDLKSRRKPT